MHSTLPRPLSCPMADRQLLVPIRTVPVVLCCVSFTVRNPSKALYQCRVVHERIAGPWQCTGFIICGMPSDALADREGRAHLAAPRLDCRANSIIIDIANVAEATERSGSRSVRINALWRLPGTSHHTVKHRLIRSGGRLRGNAPSCAAIPCRLLYPSQPLSPTA